MLDLKSLENIFLVLGLLVPGLIVLFVRSQFVTGRNMSHTDAALSYFTVSIIYYALSYPFIDFVLSIKEPRYCKVIVWFFMIFIGPSILGLLLGINVQKNIFRRFLLKSGLNPVHVIPTAWDWKFGSNSPQWVLVTLKEGTRFAGLYSDNSFSSSDPSERDIYIQWIYDIESDEQWTPRGQTGALITAGEIRTIEFWPYTPSEDSHDQT